jgi:hypothetical protein
MQHLVAAILCDDRDGIELSIWHVELWTGDVRNAATDEHDSIGWFTEAQVKQLSLASPTYVGLLFPDDR